MKKVFVSFFLLFVLFSSRTIVVQAEGSYNYSYWGTDIPSAAGMGFKRTIDGNDIGVDLVLPADLDTINGDIYILDQEQGSIIQIDSTYQLVANKGTTIDPLVFGPDLEEYITQGYESHEGICVDDIEFEFPDFVTKAEFCNRSITLNQPMGFDVSNEYIFVADTENSRIVKLNLDYEVVALYGTPNDLTFEDLAYKPTKVSVDKYGRLYVIARNVYEGIIELSKTGEFNRFTGVNRVNINPVDLFWRNLMSEAQLSRSQLYLPVEFTNMEIDGSGFIYATSLSSTNFNYSNVIQRINPSGVDVLSRNGYVKPAGDLDFVRRNEVSYAPVGISVLKDITVNQYGMYSVLDVTRNRVFTFDDEGYLLYISAESGDTASALSVPVALSYVGDDILVLDQEALKIVVYSPTIFGELVNKAVKEHFEGDFQASSTSWADTLKYNSNYQMAYIGIGKALFREGRYQEAMEMFRLGMDKQYYSKSFTKYRDAFLKEYFTILMSSFLILVATAIGLAIRKQRKGPLIDIRKYPKIDAFLENFLRFPFYVLTHPIHGFERIKYEKKARMSVAITLMVLYILLRIARFQYAGYVVNNSNPNNLNSLRMIMDVLLPIGYFVAGNWAITTLMDGKGKVKEIFFVATYAIFPILLLGFPALLLSQVINQQEATFYYLMLQTGNVLYYFLIFMGILVVHEYSLKKNILTSVLTIVSMAVLVVITMQFFDLLRQFYAFVISIYDDITLRYF